MCGVISERSWGSAAPRLTHDHEGQCQDPGGNPAEPPAPLHAGSLLDPGTGVTGLPLTEKSHGKSHPLPCEHRGFGSCVTLDELLKAWKSAEHPSCSQSARGHIGWLECGQITGDVSLPWNLALSPRGAQTHVVQLRAGRGEADGGVRAERGVLGAHTQMVSAQGRGLAERHLSRLRGPGIDSPVPGKGDGAPCKQAPGAQREGLGKAALCEMWKGSRHDEARCRRR